MSSARIRRFFSCALITTLTMGVLPASFAMTGQEFLNLKPSNAAELNREMQKAQERESADRDRQNAERIRQFQESSSQQMQWLKEQQKRQDQEMTEQLRKSQAEQLKEQWSKHAACQAQLEESKKQMQGGDHPVAQDLSCDESRAEVSH